MNQDQIDKIIDERYDSAPEKLRGVLESDHLDTVLEEVASKYQLASELLDKLDNCVTFVILGLTPPKNFIGSISETLGIDTEKASAIANEINERIFRPVRDDLRTLYEIPDNYTTPNTSQARGSTSGEFGGHEYSQNRGSTATSPSQGLSSTSRQPLSAELEERAGLHPHIPPVPRPEFKKSIDAELSESFRRPSGEGDRGEIKPTPQPSTLNPKPSVPLPPPAPPRPRPAPSFVPPAPPETGYRRQGIGYSENTNVPTSTPTSPAGKLNPLPSPVRPHAPSEPTVAKRDLSQTGQVFENSFGENHDESLSREEILRGIENPSATKPRLVQPPTTPEQPPKEYSSDPYREPLQ